MACVQITSEEAQRLSSNTTQVRYFWYTPWMYATGVDKVKPLYKLKGHVQPGAASLIVKPAIQAARIRTNDPDLPDLIGDQQLSGNGERTSAAIDITGKTASRFFVRFGMGYWLSETGEASADVSLQCAIETLGLVVATKTVSLVAPGAGPYYLPVTEWHPTMMFTKAKAIILFSNVDANFEATLARQFASTSPEVASAWTAYGTWFNSSAVENNTSELAVTPGNDEMWARLGLAYRSVNDATDRQATVTVSIAIRR